MIGFVTRASLASVACAALVLSFHSPASALTPEELRCLKSVAQTASRTATKMMKIRAKCAGSKATGRSS